MAYEVISIELEKKNPLDEIVLVRTKKREGLLRQTV